MAWAESLESAIREGRHFPHAAAKRTSFDALAKDYVETVLAEFAAKERLTRERQLAWWSVQFAGLSLADVTPDRISKARDKLAVETFRRGRSQKHPETGELTPPKEFKRSGATVNRYIAALSHALSFAVKERRLLQRNPVSDIRRKPEPRGRTRVLSDDDRARLIKACAESAWPALHTLVLWQGARGSPHAEAERLGAQ
ncbi:MAG TPA: hypothetical protein VMT66_09735 [Steroidobacteraceae bacterium]|nr:hypothetical protein [Steroidobacteraceae bacterium]